MTAPTAMSIGDIGGGLVFAGAGVAIIWFGIWLIRQPSLTARRARTWLFRDAEVIFVRDEPALRSGPRRDRRVTAITYRYRHPAGAQELVGSAQLPDGWVAPDGAPAREGGSVQILVDPEDPQKSQLADQVRGGGFSRGAPIIAMGLLLLLLSPLMFAL